MTLLPDDQFEVNVVRADQVRRHLSAMADPEELLRHVTHLPIWKSGRRPKWWGRREVLEFLVRSHRQMLLRDAQKAVDEQFGKGVTSASTPTRETSSMRP